MLAAQGSAVPRNAARAALTWRPRTDDAGIDRDGLVDGPYCDKLFLKQQGCVGDFDVEAGPITTAQIHPEHPRETSEAGDSSARACAEADRTIFGTYVVSLREPPDLGQCDPSTDGQAGAPRPPRQCLAILPGHIASQDCDAVIHDFLAYCEAHPESAEYRDEFQLHERLACLHNSAESTLRVVTDPATLAILDAAFSGPSMVVGSLFFEKGSTQSIHRDTPAFFTNPLNHYLGVWRALEDVHEGSGPLIYFEKGHLVARDAEIFQKRDITERNYFSFVKDSCIKAGLREVAFYPKKGDTVIWHPELPHGGAAIAKPGTARRSLVAHYAPEGIPIYPPSAFFDRNLPAPPEQGGRAEKRRGDDQSCAMLLS